eukprot:scaffold936_cov106-Amphora_coffeaeformis.AAC.9
MSPLLPSIHFISVPFSFYGNRSTFSFIHSFILLLLPHQVCLGDNPGGSLEGPPLSIDWEAQRHLQVKIDEYEACRQRRATEQLIIPVEERMIILKEWGYSRTDIRKLARPVHVERARRKASRLKYYANHNHHRGGGALNITDILKNIVTLGCNGKKIREEVFIDDSTTSTLASRVCDAQRAKERRGSFASTQQQSLSHHKTTTLLASSSSSSSSSSGKDPVVVDASQTSGMSSNESTVPLNV